MQNNEWGAVIIEKEEKIEHAPLSPPHQTWFHTNITPSNAFVFPSLPKPIFPFLLSLQCPSISLFFHLLHCTYLFLSLNNPFLPISNTWKKLTRGVGPAPASAHFLNGHYVPLPSVPTCPTHQYSCHKLTASAQHSGTCFPQDLTSPPAATWQKVHH